MIPKLVVSGLTLLLVQYSSHLVSTAAVEQVTSVQDSSADDSNNAGGFDGVYTSITCEHDTARLRCPGGTTVKVISANYGRTVSVNDVCPYSRNSVDKTDCISDQFTLMSRRCNHRYTCATLINNDLMRGDPCVGTYKYLNVTYTCESNGLALAASCVDNMTLYVDGNEKTFSSYWWRPSYADIPPDVTVIGIECISTNDNKRAFSGIVATFSNGDVTSPTQWKCSDTYQDGWSGVDFDASGWSSAVQVKNDSRIYRMRALPAGMSDNADWIWYNDVSDDVRARHVYCRTEITQADYCKLFDPEVDSPIKVLLSVDPVLTRIFKSACIYEANRLSTEQVSARVAELADLFSQIAQRSDTAGDKVAEIVESTSDEEEPQGGSSLWDRLKRARNNFVRVVKEKVNEYKGQGEGQENEEG